MHPLIHNIWDLCSLLGGILVLGVLFAALAAFAGTGLFFLYGAVALRPKKPKTDTIPK